MARMRAMEFERPLMRVTNTGVTSAISHKGRILQSVAHSEEGYFDIDVTPRTGATPYSMVKNYPVYAISLLVLLIAFGVKWQTRRRSGDQTSSETEGQTTRRETEIPGAEEGSEIANDAD